jgi:hypothetical protein
LAFWGIGIEMQLLLRKIGLPNTKNVYLIDKDIKKQGLTFMGHEIHPPAVLAEKQVSMVLLTPLAPAAINNTIAQDLCKLDVTRVKPFQSLLKLLPKTDRSHRLTTNQSHS